MAIGVTPRPVAVPMTLEARLEIIKAIHSLSADDEDAPRLRRQAETAVNLNFVEPAGSLRDECRALSEFALSHLRKYSADEPRVPKHQHGGGEWTRGATAAAINDSRILSDAPPPWVAGARYAAGAEESEREGRLLPGPAELALEARLQIAQLRWNDGVPGARHR